MLVNLVKQAVVRVLENKEISFNVSKISIHCEDSVENFKSQFDDALGVRGKQQGGVIEWFVPLENLYSETGVEVRLDVERDTFAFKAVKEL